MNIAEKDKQRIKMIKTQDPDILPNGTLGYAHKKIITERGLHRAYFDNGAVVAIYRNEIEPI